MMPFLKIDSKGFTNPPIAEPDSKPSVGVPTEVVFFGVLLFALMGFLALLLGTSDVLGGLDLGQNSKPVSPSTDQD